MISPDTLKKLAQCAFTYSQKTPTQIVIELDPQGLMFRATWLGASPFPQYEPPLKHSLIKSIAWEDEDALGYPFDMLDNFIKEIEEYQSDHTS